VSDNPEGTSFFRSRKMNTMYVAMVVIGIIGFLFGLVAGPGSSSLGILVIWGIFMLATKNKPLLSFHDTHLTIKLAPLAPLHLIAYKDIENIAVRGKKVHLSVSGRPKPILLPLNSFDENDHGEIEGILQKIVATNQTQLKK
jgi:hypothetical protein